MAFEVGACDLAGRDVVLTGFWRDTYVPADVRWRDFGVFEGEASCQ